MNKISNEKLYPIFVPDILRTAYNIYETDKNERLYVKEIMGIPVCAYDPKKHGCLTISGVENETRELYTFEEICNMSNVRCNFQRFDETIGENSNNDKYVVQYINKGFDMREVYTAALCASTYIFQGSEIILCKRFMKEIADKLKSNLYLYLYCIDSLIILPESSLTNKMGIINLFNELKYFDSLAPVSIDCAFCSKIFYYNRKKENYTEIISRYDVIDFEL